MPEEVASCRYDNVYDEYSENIQVGENETEGIVDIFSIHSRNGTGNGNMT